MTCGRISRHDRLTAAALWLLTVAVFSAGAARLGFYADDDGWLITLPSTRVSALWPLLKGYVPGRNLHVVWQYLLFQAVGDPVAHLAALHLLHSAIDGLVAAGFFLLLRMLSLPAAVATMAAGLFSFWPTHGETHFWPTSLGANLLPVLFTLLFAVTSLALVSRQGRGGWLWPVDFAALACALLTYDQVFFALLGIAALRLAVAILEGWPRRWIFVCAHLPYAAAGLFYQWARTKRAPGSFVALRPDTAQMLGVNIPETISYTIGKLWWRQVSPFWANTTSADWALALAAGAALTALALWRWRASAPAANAGGLRPVFLLGLGFYLASYLPIWFWYIAPRHHCLPSLGLFAGGAAALAAALGRLRRPAAVALMVTLGLAAGAFAAADRGESRYWEEAFAIKSHLFADLKPDLRDMQILVLEDFPPSLGPASLISAFDAELAPRLLYRDPGWLRPEFTGAVSYCPAPGGIFLGTEAADGPDEFVYYPTDRFLGARFTGWERGVLRFETAPPQPPPYEVISRDLTVGNASFRIDGADARRQGRDLVASLRFEANLHPRTYLIAVFSFLHGGAFRRWTRLDRSRSPHLIPVLLSPGGLHPPSGGYRWAETLRLYSFPAADRIRIEFFQAAAGGRPSRLGEWTAVVTP